MILNKKSENIEKMVERDKSHDEELVRWANYVKENPEKWKAKLKAFLDAQIIIARRFRMGVMQ